MRPLDLIKKFELMEKEIENDKQALQSMLTPMALLLARAEKAESALKASDIALNALKILQVNSLETISLGHVLIESMTATIQKNKQDATFKERTLTKLTNIIEKNKSSLKVSAQALAAVSELAYADALTGLPNRRLLNDRLRQIIATNRRWSSHGAAIFLDLDKFKRLNDVFGHEVGDQLLIAVGSRIKLFVRETDTVARYGGDEFVVLLNRLDSDLTLARAESESIANKILNALNAPYPLYVNDAIHGSKMISYQNFASLGIAMFGGDLSDASQILDWADEAMYWAKSEGGQTIRFYDSKNLSEQALTELYQLAIDNDDETANHCIRTRKYVKTLARRSQQMNLYPDKLTDEIIERLFKATPLHDIGKTEIPYAVLHKKCKHTPEEWEVMKTHAALGGVLLLSAKKQNIDLSKLMDTAIEIATTHHENWDGSGYPRNLKGTEIPLGGRLMAIADVYDALISKRNYKESWCHEDACNEIISLSGSKFDPFLIEAFKREKDNFRLIAEIEKD